VNYVKHVHLLNMCALSLLRGKPLIITIPKSIVKIKQRR